MKVFLEMRSQSPMDAVVVERTRGVLTGPISDARTNRALQRRHIYMPVRTV